MKKIYFCFLIVITCFFAVNCGYCYERSPHVTKTIWSEVEPYFLPEDHPIKANLDEIFTKTRASSDMDSLKKAGFKTRKPTKNNQMVVAKHPKLSGYLLKLVPDSIDHPYEWLDWQERVIGAQLISDAVEAHHYNHIMKVPKKWIYPLPAKPSPPKDYYRKNFILVVEEMDILKHDENFFWWRSIAMTYEKMDAIYIIFQELGLYDSVFPFNVPFCKDGRMAFIDTQWFHDWPIKFERLTEYFPAHMRDYWEALVEHDGPCEETEKLKRDPW